MNANRPGLRSFSYRAGTFSSFFEAMKARLSSADYPALAALRTRDPADWSIALLDAWAAVADVLTFYQERIANEGYVRTLTERFSILELGRTVGYTLRPGVAATAYLAYTLDQSADVTIPAGTRTQSTPAQGQLPQSFETSDPLHARGGWNTLGVRTAQPQRIDLSSAKNPVPGELSFQGTSLNLNPDDVLLIVDPNHPVPGSGSRPLEALVRVVSATPQTAPGQANPSFTRVALDPIWPAASGTVSAGFARRREGSPAPAAASQTSQLLTGYEGVAGQLLAPPASHPANALRLDKTIATTFGSNSDALAKALTVLHPALESTLLPALQHAVESPAQPVEVYAFRINALPFGANAPKQLLGFRDEGRGEPDALRNVAEYGEWPLAADENPETLYLDRYYPALVATNSAAVSYAVILHEGHARPTIAKVTNVDKIGRAQYGISGTSSKLTLEPAWYANRQRPPHDLALLRQSHVYAQSEKLQLAAIPIGAPVPEPGAAAEIELDGVYDGLEPGRWLIVSGMRTDVPGVPASELVMLSTTQHTLDPTLPGDTLRSTLTLSNPLSYQYDRQSVKVYANVVRVTHGETRTEVLGSGDGGSVLQRFALKASPLTYVAVPTAAGVQSTLQVTVNGLPWTESDDFDSLGPNDRAFITRTDNAGMTTVIFGDGVHGARLPTGTENVIATYRVGIGRSGNVDAGQLTLLASRPLGVRAVSNPLPASGGADPEDVDQARANVALASAALDRIVSTGDYAAVARTFAGVAKAFATRFPGAPATVHVTIAADADETLDPASPILQNLEATLQAQGDTRIRLDVQARSLVVLVLSANVVLQSGYPWEAVAPAIRAKLLDAFGFDRRALAQDVYLTEIIAAAGAVDGVASVEVVVFDGFAGTEALGALASAKGPPSASVTASAPQLAPDGTILPAQLAIFKPELPDAIVLVESGG
jgi:predicted phage baseplate assembly protein